MVLILIERSPKLVGGCSSGSPRSRLGGIGRARRRRRSTTSSSGLGLFRDLPRLLWVFLPSFLMFGVFAVCATVSMWALHIDVPWYAGLVMLVITAIGIMVPAAPGYIGTPQPGVRRRARAVPRGQGARGAVLVVPVGGPVGAGHPRRAALPAARGAQPGRDHARGQSGEAEERQPIRQWAAIRRTASHTSRTSCSLMRGNSGNESARAYASSATGNDSGTTPSVSRKWGWQVDRDEVHRGADVLGAQLLDELPAIDAQPLELERDRAEVPRVRDTGRTVGRRTFGHLGEQSVVERDPLAAQALELVEALELPDADRRQHVAQVVLVARAPRPRSTTSPCRCSGATRRGSCRGATRGSCAR